MFAPPSLQHEYTLVFSGDPALMLPDDEKERAAKLRAARETGRWAELCKPGEQPTLFTIRPIEGPLLTWLHGYSSRARLSNDEGMELALRVALKGVENLGAFEITHSKIEGRVVVSEDTMAALYAIGRELGDPMLGRRVVIELGTLVLDRAMEGIPPKPSRD